MRFWNFVVARPGVWLLSGAVIGAVAMAGVLTQKAGVQVARATPPVSALPASLASSPGFNELQILDQTFADLVQEIEPSVVHIRSGGRARGEGMAPQLMPVPGGQGSGVIYSEDGWIVTNDHVVDGASRVVVVLSDGREFEGKVTRSMDAQNDIAVVKIDAKGLKPARFGNSDSVRPGQFAIAVGAPFGLENTVTIGHISGLGRASVVQNRGYSNMIQTDAPINPGNSGGPLLNIRGEVIGINTSIIGNPSLFGTAGNVGIGFAIPSNQVRLIADKLIKEGKLVRGYMGIRPETIRPYEARELGLAGGARVADVPEDGPAAKAGLKVGDVIVRVGDVPVRTDADVRNAMLKYAPGQTVPVEILREKRRMTLSVTVAELPAELRMDAPRERPNLPDLPDLDRDWPFNQFPELRERFRPRGNPPGMEPGRPARLGVGFSELNENTRRQFSLPESAVGVVVTSVEPGSVAERIGIRVGDVITQVGNEKIASGQDIVRAMGEVRTGQTVPITWMRYAPNGQMSFTVTATF